MKKFSKIVESSNEIKFEYDPKKAIKDMVDYFYDTDETRHFLEYFSERLDLGFDEYKEFREEYRNVNNFEEFKKWIIKYNIKDEVMGEIMYSVEVARDFLNNLPDVDSYMKKINED